MNTTTNSIEDKVIELRNDGLGYKTIANKLNISKDKVIYYSKKNNLSGFIACGSLIDEAYDRFIKGFNDKHGDKFIYVSGFKGSESIVMIRCKKCGDEFERNAQISRKNRQLKCLNCQQIAKELLAKEKESQKEYANAERKRLLLEKQKEREKALKGCCKECGITFKSNRIGLKYCSDRCRKRHNNRAKELLRRNKLLLNGDSDKDISIERLIEKEQNICYICGKECDDNDYTITNDGYFVVGNKYPTIEHVIPISKGGMHKWDNIKLAHHYCNTIKSNKMLGTISPP